MALYLRMYVLLLLVLQLHAMEHVTHQAQIPDVTITIPTHSSSTKQHSKTTRVLTVEELHTVIKECRKSTEQSDLPDVSGSGKKEAKLSPRLSRQKVAEINQEYEVDPGVIAHFLLQFCSASQYLKPHESLESRIQDAFEHDNHLYKQVQESVFVIIHNEQIKEDVSKSSLSAESVEYESDQEDRTRVVNFLTHHLIQDCTNHKHKADRNWWAAVISCAVTIIQEVGWPIAMSVVETLVNNKVHTPSANNNGTGV